MRPSTFLFLLRLLTQRDDNHQVKVAVKATRATMALRAWLRDDGARKQPIPPIAIGDLATFAFLRDPPFFRAFGCCLSNGSAKWGALACGLQRQLRDPLIRSYPLLDIRFFLPHI